MTQPIWPPQPRYPIEEWTDNDLLDQYRHIKSQFAGEDSDYLDDDDNVAALIQEIIRRGLDGLAEAVADDPANTV